MGTLTSFFGGGGGSPLPQPEWLFQKSSYTYTFPYDGTVIVHVVGAGGSGAAQSNWYGCTGGGAGGYCRKQFSVTTSTTATVTTGTGGYGVGNFQTEAEGISGGNTTFVLGSDTLTANGGTGGKRYPSANQRAAGGTASGGDVNYTGGSSGDNNFGYNSQYVRATGGGAVNLFGLSNVNGGDCDNGTQILATGGGGVGGKGGTSNNNSEKNATGGGGSAGPAEDIANDGNGSGRCSAGGQGGSRLFLFTGPVLDGVGGRGLMSMLTNGTGRVVYTPTDTIGMGAGSGGLIAIDDYSNEGAEGFVPMAGLFGGGGALASEGFGGMGGSASLGGGGGGATTKVSSSSNCKRVSGAGGDGVVIIEYIERG